MHKEMESPGIIIGNRDFFPDKLTSGSRTEILEAVRRLHVIPSS